MMLQSTDASHDCQLWCAHVPTGVTCDVYVPAGGSAAVGARAGDGAPHPGTGHGGVHHAGHAHTRAGALKMIYYGPVR